MARYFANLVSLLFYLTFFYQFCSITKDYLRYRTITKVEPYVEDPTNLPAFTFNFNTLIPVVELYSKVFPNLSYPFNNTYSKRPSWLNTSLGRYCKNVFDNNLEYNEIPFFPEYWEEFFSCIVHIYPNKTFVEYLKNLQKLFHPIKYSDMFFPFRCDFDEDNYNFLRKNGEALDVCNDWTQISIGNGGTLGLTLFAQSTTEIKVRSGARFTIRFNIADFQPFKEQGSPYVQLHASDEPPHHLLFKMLMDTNHQISYYRTKIIRLPPPYDTFCYDYKKVPLNGSISQKDCFAQCYFNKKLNTTANSFKNYFLLSHGYFIKHDLFWPSVQLTDILREEDMENDDNLLTFSMSLCHSLCPKDCDYVFYDWALLDFPKNWETEDQQYIFFSHQFDNDILFTHMSIVDLFEYLASVGGLAGMWVGFSFLSLWQQVNNSSVRPRCLATSTFSRLSRRLNRIKQKISGMRRHINIRSERRNQNIRRARVLFN